MVSVDVVMCSWCFGHLFIDLVFTPEVISEAWICQCIVKGYCVVKCHLKSWWAQCALWNPEDYCKTWVGRPSSSEYKRCCWTFSVELETLKIYFKRKTVIVWMRILIELVEVEVSLWWKVANTIWSWSDQIVKMLLDVSTLQGHIKDIHSWSLVIKVLKVR